jgi:hypothetical protein
MRYSGGPIGPGATCRHFGTNVARLESAEGQPGRARRNKRKIRAALETSGIEFIEENETG